MKFKLRFLLTISMALLVHSMTDAQIFLQTLPGQSKVTIKGTSTMHDWEMQAVDFDIRAELETDGPEIKFNNILFSGKAAGLKSKHDLMDVKAREALKYKQNPEIIFQQKDFTIIQHQGMEFKGKVLGKLSIAGVSKNIEIPFDGTFKSNQILAVNGSLNLKMSEFGIKPPTAIMGTIKTGDDILLIFNLELKSDKMLTLLK